MSPLDRLQGPGTSRSLVPGTCPATCCATVKSRGKKHWWGEQMSLSSFTNEQHICWQHSWSGQMVGGVHCVQIWNFSTLNEAVSVLTAPTAPEEVRPGERHWREFCQSNIISKTLLERTWKLSGNISSQPNMDGQVKGMKKKKEDEEENCSCCYKVKASALLFTYYETNIVTQRRLLKRNC